MGIVRIYQTLVGRLDRGESGDLIENDIAEFANTLPHNDLLNCFVHACRSGVVREMMDGTNPYKVIIPIFRAELLERVKMSETISTDLASVQGIRRAMTTEIEQL